MPQSHFNKVASYRFTTSFKRGTGVFLWVLRNFSEDLFKRMQVFWKTATETGYKSFSSALWNHRNSLGTKWERICPSWKYILREKCPNTEFFQVRIFPHSDWIRWDTPYLSVFSPNAGKYSQNSQIFTEKHLWQSFYFNKVAGLRLQLTCFAVNFAKFLIAPFLQNMSGRLLLTKCVLYWKMIFTTYSPIC